MSIVIKTFGYQALTEAVNQMIPVPSFIRNLLFKRVETHTTKTVLTDIVVGGQKIAPFVKRGAPAAVMGNLGQKTSLVEPPNIKLKKLLTPEDLLFTRGAGAPMFVPGGSAGASPIKQAQEKKIALEQKDLKDTIDRTIEFLCAKGLTGSYSITQNDLSFSIDFSMPSDNKPVLATTAKWDAPTTCKPLKNLREWKLIAQKASGKIPTAVIMSPASWELFLASDEVVKYLDKLRINLGSIQTDSTVLSAGAEKKATIENLDFYVYSGVYTNSSGAQVQMIDDGYVSMVCPNADHRLQFGAIEDLEAGSIVGQYYSKDWLEKDPSGLWLLVESHPLPTFNEPGSMIYAKVA